MSKITTVFSIGGVTVDNVRLMRQIVRPKMGVKASGGVRDYESAGCNGRSECCKAWHKLRCEVFSGKALSRKWEYAYQ